MTRCRALGNSRGWPRCGLRWLTGATLSLPVLVGAQEALFNSAAHQRLATQTRSGIESMPYTFRLREFRAVVRPTLGIEWNDNVLTSDANKKQDISFSPRLEIHAVHPLGENNRISFDLGLGYTKYLRQTQLDQLVITPGSTVDFDFAVGQVRFNLHDRLTYNLDPTAVGAVAGRGSSGGLNNTAGLTAGWQLHRVDMSVGYDFLRFISESDTQSQMDRSTHSVMARVGVDVYPGVVVGTEATAAPTIYDDSFLNDSTGYSLGGYGDWKVTDRFHVAPRGGYSLTTFSPNQEQGTRPDYAGFYFGLSIDHRPNETIAYRLSANRQISPGVDANVSDSYLVDLGITWKFIRDFPFTTSFFFEDGTQAGGGQLGAIVASGDLETWNRYGGNLSINQELTKRLNASLSYGLIYRTSSLPDRDYLQNRVTLTLSYRL